MNIINLALPISILAACLGMLGCSSGILPDDSAGLGGDNIDSLLNDDTSNTSGTTNMSINVDNASLLVERAIGAATWHSLDKRVFLEQPALSQFALDYVEQDNLIEHYVCDNGGTMVRDFSLKTNSPHEQRLFNNCQIGADLYEGLLRKEGNVHQAIYYYSFNNYQHKVADTTIKLTGQMQECCNGTLPELHAGIGRYSSLQRGHDDIESINLEYIATSTENSFEYRTNQPVLYSEELRGLIYPDGIDYNIRLEGQFQITYLSNTPLVVTSSLSRSDRLKDKQLPAKKWFDSGELTIQSLDSDNRLTLKPVDANSFSINVFSSDGDPLNGTSIIQNWEDLSSVFPEASSENTNLSNDWEPWND